MNLKQLKNIINDHDLEDLVHKIDHFYKKNEILHFYFQLLNIQGSEKNIYIEDFNQVKHEPIQFRQSCLRYIEKAHEDLKIHDLIELAKLF